VRIAVDLDRQPGLGAIEVGQTAADDKPPDRMLAPQLEAQLAVAHRMPQLRFRRRQRMTEVSSALEDGG